MKDTTTASDFPRLPVGETSIHVFHSAAEASAGEGAYRTPGDERSGAARTITSLQRRVLASPDQPVRLGAYDVLRCIGAGGMGVVYEAIHVQRGQRVALKTLRRMGARALARFKNEFRAMEGVAHPNLVAPFELVLHEGIWFFTMQYVEGMSFIDYVHAGDDRSHPAFPYLGATLQSEDPAAPPKSARNPAEARARPRSPGPFHEGRLRAALRELAVGLGALHEHGKLHRDINSANVLVTREGRAMILDFGLVESRFDPRAAPGPLDCISGTPGYISPEQAAMKPATPASDWYGFGVMLFEALTGQLPFGGNATRVMIAKQRCAAPSPSELVTGVPADLEDLCVGLLQTRPTERPSGPEVLRALHAPSSRGRRRPPSIAEARPPPATGRFVGRDDALGILRGAFGDMLEGAPATVVVRGPAGVGKTALLRHFVDAIVRKEEDAVVLSARCREAESIPHRAFDPIVDALALELRGLPDDDLATLLPPEARDVAALFPVLACVPGITPRTPGVDDPEVVERLAFAGLRRMLARLAAARPLVVTIDDFQWARADDARLLADLVGSGNPPGMLLVVAHRSEAMHVAGAARDLSRRLAARDVRLDPLAHEHARALAVRVSLLRADAEAVALASGGSPQRVLDLARHAEDGEDPISEEGLVAGRLARLPERARQLLEVIAAAGRPVEQGLAIEVARVGDAAGPLLTLLRASYLVRTQGDGDGDLIEAYDDPTAAVTVARIAPDPLCELHRRLGEAMSRRPEHRADVVADHFHRGGDLERAAAYAAAAAEEAAGAGAFERAATLSGRALGWMEPGSERARALRLTRAQAFVSAGRPADAAAILLAEARRAPAAEALDLRRRAAEQLLVGGHIDAGVRELRAALDGHGIDYPKTERRALVLLGVLLLRLRVQGTAFDQRTPQREDRAHVEVLWSAAKGLSPFDPVRSGVFCLQALRRALASGDAPFVARALGYAGCLLVHEGSPAAVHRGDRLIEQAALLAWRSGDPYLSGFASGCSGIARMCRGRFREALSRMDEGLRLLEEHRDGVTWERHAYRTVSIRALGALGELRERGRRASAWLAESRGSGDLFGEVEAGLHDALSLMAAGDPVAARAGVRAAIGRWWCGGGVSFQHHTAIAAETSCDLYEGRAADAWARIASAWPALEASHLLRIQLLRIDARLLRGVCAAAAAEADPSRAPELLRGALADAAALSREPRAHAHAAAALVRAGCERLRGRPAAARDELEAAAKGYDATEMAVHAACVRRAHGQLVGGAQGRALISGADAALSAEGVRDPERWAAMITGLGRW